VEEFVQQDCGITLDTTSLAVGVELTHSCVRTIREKAQKKQGPPHRRLALANKQELQLCEVIREKAIPGNYVTKRELLNDIEASFYASLTYSWIRCRLKHRVDCVKNNCGTR
jgi:hypothetical protein